MRAALLMCLIFAACVSGCSREAEHPAVDSAGLDSRYVGLEYADGHVVLELRDDGTFLLRGRVPEGEEMRAHPPELGRGVWTLSAAGLELGGGSWLTVFEPDSAYVEIPTGADVLRTLRWVDSTSGSPFNACDLVSFSDLENLLRPPEGSGSEGG
jgi:hypothetical protein